MDRISELPDFIVHHILSSINSTVDLVRMSVLSKKWFDLTASFPVLDFNIRNFRSQESFFKYVEYTASRFCHQNVTAQKFNIVTTTFHYAELDTVNRCLDLVLKNGVRELVIDISNVSDVQKYFLPNTLLSVSVLKCLKIRGCELPSSLTVDAIKFKSLIRLKLENVPVNDDAIKYLTTSCPLLEEFDIRSCHGFKSFCVYGHQSLQKVWADFSTQVERIDIEAPNLSDLYLANRDGRGAPQMNLDSCKKLTTVTYVGYPLQNSNGFTDFLSNFPFVTSFVLVTSYKCNNLKLSSHSLRTLVLHSQFDLEEIEFSTPNLDLFIYSCDPAYLWPMVMHLPHLKACMRCYPDGSLDALWFQKLRVFLDKKNGFKALNLYIHTSQKFIVLEKLKPIELPPYDLKHVELHLDTHDDHAAFVDAVLQCFRPRSLTLRSSFPLTDFDEQSDLVKFTHDKLLQQEDQGDTIVQIVSPSSFKAQKHFRGLMQLPGELPREEKAISFIKEEVIQKEAG